MHLPTFMLWHECWCYLFGSHLIQFCSNRGLILFSKSLLPNAGYIYISEAWHSTSWLDHCLCTVDAHDSMEMIQIDYDLSTTDHIPFLMVLNIGNLPVMLPVDNGIGGGKIDWSKLSINLMLCCVILRSHLMQYCVRIWTVKKHCRELCSLYETIVESLGASRRPLHIHIYMYIGQTCAMLSQVGRIM